MGKSLYSQRRGKGSPTFRNQRKGEATSYYPLKVMVENPILKGQVVDLIKESGRNNILAKIMFENGIVNYVIAPEGLFIGDDILSGATNEVTVGNIAPLAYLPEGCPVFNIEHEAGDGGKIVKAAGSYALLVSKDEKFATIKMPSGKTMLIPLNCRATIGCSAAGGRREKPLVKAGTAYHAARAKTKKYWSCRGVTKNACDHPFGGAQHHPGRSKSTSRNAPPGRKVGAIASKRTGRRKK
ncbi:MAG: 50S ribosomal protein L2 [Candidatus Diapherotrites archaeon CG08_land_8_20_14_0_20_34_12]|nr:MAG: 50S ribosomal protein L2 [Candidatus Diapherotrites archaeon CG08_land_8_20_14_0_20_34_12]